MAQLTRLFRFYDCIMIEEIEIKSFSVSLIMSLSVGTNNYVYA